MAKARTSKPRPNRVVLVADRARARFFTIESDEDVSGPILVERADLVNPESELKREEAFSDTRSGRRNKAGVTGGGYSMDKKMERHEAEFDRRFAKELAARTRELVEQLAAGRLVIAAAPRFLGRLRPELATKLPEGVALLEFATDLTWQTPARIRAALVRNEVLHLDAFPSVARRPKSQHPRATPSIPPPPTSRRARRLAKKRA